MVKTGFKKNRTSGPADSGKACGRPHQVFAPAHRPAMSSNPPKRLIGEIKRRTEVGIFPNGDAITRLVGAILFEQDDERAVQRARYMTLETIAPLSDDPVVSLPALAG